MTESEAWKALGTNTEAGRLLRRIYASKGAPAIAYPKVTVAKESWAPHERFNPGGGSVESVDPRSRQFQRDTGLVVPSVAAKDKVSVPPLIDAHAGKRRTMRTIAELEAEQKKRADRSSRGGVGGGAGMSREREKQRLQFINQFRGGVGPTAVPALDIEVPARLYGATSSASSHHPSSHHPSSRLPIHASRAPSPLVSDSSRSTLVRELEATRKSLQEGIEERRRFVSDMHAIDPARARRVVKEEAAEAKALQKQLKDIEKELAELRA